MQATLTIKLARVAIVIAIFALWELLSRTGLVNPRLLPSASDTLMTLGDLLEGIVLHAFEGKAPFGKDTLRKIAELRKVYGLDLDASASHRLTEAAHEA